MRIIPRCDRDRPFGRASGPKGMSAVGKGNWSAPSRHRSNGRYRASRPSATIGWSPRPESVNGETVAAVVDRDRLGDVLASLHGQGYGSNTRVLDGARGDLAAQLVRAGVQGSAGDINLGDRQAETAVVLIHAPGRGERVLTLLARHGPRDVHVFGGRLASSASSLVREERRHAETDDPVISY